MKTINLLTSACRHCRHYQPEGRRGGMCQMLGAPVQSSWKACVLAIPAFASAWEGLEGIMILPDTSAVVTPSLVSTMDVSQFEAAAELSVGYNPEQRKAKSLV